jgi:hypothetical protein
LVISFLFILFYVLLHMVWCLADLCYIYIFCYCCIKFFMVCVFGIYIFRLLAFVYRVWIMLRCVIFSVNCALELVVLLEEGSRWLLIRNVQCWVFS